MGEEEVATEDRRGVPRSKPSGPSAFRARDARLALTAAPALCFSQPQLQALHPGRTPQHPLSLRGS